MDLKKSKDKKPITRARKIYNIVSTIVVVLVFVLLVLVVGVVLWQRSSGNDTALFGYYLYDIVTDSMQDTINPKDVILSKKIDDVNTLKEGDIITFTAPSGPLAGHNETHRINSIVRNADGSIKHIKTAGDNKYGGDSVKVDSWNLNPSAVKAVYVKKLPFIGDLREFLTHWYGYVVLIALPLVIVAALFIAGFVKDKTTYEMEKARLKNVAVPNEAKVTLDMLDENEKERLLNEMLLKTEKQSSEAQGDEKTTDEIEDIGSE